MTSLKRTEISYKDTRLVVLTSSRPKADIRAEVIRQHGLLEGYARRDPLFLSAYGPLDIKPPAPEIVRRMGCAAKKAGVGPMAAVAGAFSDIIGNILLHEGQTEVIVENGGDIFMKVSEERTIRVHAGPSDFSDRLGLRMLPKDTPVGVCTSSASVGPSISLGQSDAVTVLAKDAALADACATAIGNAVRGPEAIKKGIEKAASIKGIRGALLIKGDSMGTWGRIPELIRV